MLRWSVAIFACNEQATIGRSIETVISECAGERAEIHVVVNGSTDRTLAIARDYAKRNPGRVFSHHIAHADKQNAWNQYVHALRTDAEAYIFVDAYAYVTPGSFQALHAALKPGVNAAAAIPMSGRSRHRIIQGMREGGGLHGSLHALSRDFIERVRALNFRQPIGLYRGDGLVGAMALLNLDYSPGWRYDYTRIALVESASWTFAPLRAWRWADLKRQFRRFLRQQRGPIESQAIVWQVRRTAFKSWPTHADTLITGYLADGGKLSANPIEAALQRHSLRGISNARPAPERLALVRDSV